MRIFGWLRGNSVTGRDGETYLTLEDGETYLAVYRVRTDGVLKRLRGRGYPPRESIKLSGLSIPMERLVLEVSVLRQTAEQTA